MNIKEAAPTREHSTVFKTVAGEAAYLAAYDEALSRWPVPYESIYVPTTFGDTHVIASGPREAPPLVLLHAMAASSTMWLPNAAALSQAHRVLAVDIMGNPGRSVYAKPMLARSDYTQWLIEVLDGLGVDQTDMAGLSYGGWLTLSFSLQAPTRLKKVVLLAPAATLKPFRPSFYVHFLAPMFFPSRASVGQTFRWMSATGREADENLADQMYLAIKHFRFPKGIYPSVFTDDELKEANLPALLLIGEQEVIYDPSAALDRARRLMPNLQSALVPGASHLLNIEQPEIVNRRILDFLDEPAGKNA